MEKGQKTAFKSTPAMRQAKSPGSSFDDLRMAEIGKVICMVQTTSAPETNGISNMAYKKNSRVASVKEHFE